LELPEDLISSLTGVAGFNPVSFRKIHEEGREPVSIRINQKKWKSLDNEGNAAPSILSKQSMSEMIPWCSSGSYLKARPSFTFDPHFHAGVYYVQEASSMFLEQALKQSIDLSRSLKVLDLCAAPGGKSTHIQSLISSDSLLVSNEVIKSRVSILEENLTKWGGINTIVTQNDPHAFRRLEGFFDVIVVDAPCSGSGLFRREPEAIREWTPDLVKLCSKRQQRILADVLPALKSGGLLIYSTCSYSPEENENIIDWLVHDSELEPVSLVVPALWGIVESTSPNAKAIGYRFYPNKLKG
jgi:16S rRNA C967 or C1407 C5-methylase (RsmB/RsmF family)